MNGSQENPLSEYVQDANLHTGMSIRKKKNKKIRSKRETTFIKNYFSHDLWEYEPVSFLLRNGTKYTPDFFDFEKKVFIEVVGTRQAFSYNKTKYSLFVKDYPTVNILFLTKTGCEFAKKKHKTIVVCRNPSWGDDELIARQIRDIDEDLFNSFKQKCIRLEVTANQRILDLIEKDAKSK